MNLYLVQHAEAKSEAEDAERSLSAKGLADITNVAAWLNEHAGIEVRSILHSGKTRARQTAEILTEHLQPPEGANAAEDLNPKDDPSIWARRLAQTLDDAMLVGHLPHLSRLASQLLCEDENRTLVKFQLGGMVCLGRDEAKTWSVRWMLIPQLI